MKKKNTRSAPSPVCDEARIKKDVDERATQATDEENFREQMRASEKVRKRYGRALRDLAK